MTHRRSTLGLVLPALALLLAASGVPRAQISPAVARLVRVVEANDAGVPESESAGLLLPARSDLHLALDASHIGPASIVLRDRDADRDESRGHAFEVPDPINFAFAERPDGSFRVLAFDGTRGDLTQVDVSDVGKVAGATVNRPSVAHWGVSDPRGLTVDPVTGAIFILDGEGARIVRVADGVGRDARISEIDLPPGLEGLRGIAVNPADGHLHLLSPSAQELYELDGEGRFLALRKLVAAGPLDPQVMAFAASSDRTDDRWQSHLFLAVAAGPDGGSVLTEWSLKAATRRGKTAATHEAILVQEIDTSAFDPPSPDSAGIAHKQASDSLLMADSEVNEMSIYGGFNVFELTRSGIRFDRFDTTDFSDEPTGVAIDPANGHCFFSDDTGNKSIYEVDPGPDGRCLTDNDSVTSFSTEDFGSADPEGVAFGQGTLFIVDGVNREVYRVSPGSNGVFDGSDDEVTSCDTAGLGVDDPSGVGFDSTSGALYIVGRPTDQVFQISTDCDLLRVIDISAADARKPVGLTLAPSSVNPAVTSLWITDSGVDNNTQSDENDGRIYELSLPSATPGNTAPVVAAGPDLDIALGDSALLQGRVIDDGLPSPGSLTRMWSPVSGPGEVTFVDARQEVTYVSFSAAGTYVLRLTGDDGYLQSSDDVVVTVSHSDGSTVFERRVEASEDDAEENDQGSVNRTSTDLELVFARGNQTVGIRFADVDIPPGATILEAHLQLQANEADSDVATLTLEAEAVDHAAPFLEADGDISSRARTAAFASWSAAPWIAVGDAGPAQRSPDLSAVIQEIVNRPGWARGNALALVITGNGTRTAESFDGRAAGAPLLHVRFAADGNAAPSVTIDTPREGASASEGDPVRFTGTATDAEDGDLSAALTWVSDLDGALGSGPDFMVPGLSPGLHTITAAVTDRGGRAASDQIAITVNAVAPPASGTVFERRVTASEDDAEEDEQGSVNRTSANLELGFAGGAQAAGIRFAGVDVPPGGTILEAYLQLQANEAGSAPTFLTVEGEAADHAAPFVEADGDITSRARTAASASWRPVAWSTMGEAGLGQRSTELSAVIQEIVDRPGWVRGNALALVITGKGARTAESYDGNAAGAPLLHVRYAADGNAAPSVTIDTPRDGTSVNQGSEVPFGGTAIDAEDGDLSANLSWLSSLDGALGTGASVTASNLSLGLHTITAAVTDSGTRGSTDQITITITPKPSPPADRVFERRVEASEDDAEEAEAGSVNRISTDLELVFARGNQTVGVRFAGVDVPPGATILEAYLQLQANEADSDAATLTLEGEAVDHAAPFLEADGDISSRARTAAFASWSAAPWIAVGDSGPDQKSPDLSAVVQEIVDRPGWSSGNALAFVITGNGTRTAESFDGRAAGAPLLHVRYAPDGNAAPSVTIDTPRDGASVPEGDPVRLTGTATDAEDGDLSAGLAWVSDLDGALGSGPDFTIPGLSLGRHTITASVTDGGGRAAGDQLVLTVWAGGDAPVLVGAGDIADCGSGGDEATANLLDAIPGTVFTTGDHAYPDGTEAELAECYEPSWGRHKARTRPTPGNHDYHVDGAAPYFDYFGSAAGEPGKGYYSYDVGTWHVIALNSDCSEAGGCSIDSPQGSWLQADLAANPSACTLAYWHNPRFSSGRHGSSSRFEEFWQLLYQAGADVVVNGHDHVYERFAPQDPTGAADPNGIREFVVGTGGSHLTSFESAEPNSEVREADSFGVLKLTLHPTHYDWEFVPVAGSAFSDSGSAPCVLEALNVSITAPADGTHVNLGDSVTLTGRATDAVGSDLSGDLAWVSSRDGALGTGASIVVSGLSLGLHTLTASVPNGGGLEASAQIALTVMSVPLQDPTASFAFTCSGLDCSFTDTSSDSDGSIAGWAWNFGDGSPLIDLQNPGHSYASEGTYTVTLTVADDDGGTGTASRQVVASANNSHPVADAGPDQTVRVGETVTLDGGGSSDADGDPLGYFWTLTSVPLGSSASLSDATSVRPRFVADVAGAYGVQLVVDDGMTASAPDTVTLSSENSAPVADAGADQTVRVGEMVTLDGSGSSDADGDPLHYAWSLTSLPPGSNASLSSASAVTPSFAADVAGTYVAELVVVDGLTASAPDTVTLSSENSAPVADAGLDRTVRVGEMVTLDGGGSSDADGDSLRYAWSITSLPAGSGATLFDGETARPAFVADMAGTYVVQLMVDDARVVSAPDTVTISSENSPPVAEAGLEQTVRMGETVTVDGGASSDPDGDPLSFAWSFTSVPPGSRAALSDATEVTSRFVADAIGTYVVQLIVDDGRGASLPDTVTITSENSPPVADAGRGQTVHVGQTVVLDAGGSSDADGDPLGYAWSFMSAPPNSNASLSDAATRTPSFVVDVVGLYVVQLVVDDGQDSSLPDTVLITSENTPPVADAGPDRTVRIGETVTFDGSGSSDPDGDPLGYAWSFTSLPVGSSAALFDAMTAAPNFVVDVAGSYVAQLTVSDGRESSAPDSVTFSVENSVPVADAGPDRTVRVGETMTFDGSGSSDADGDSLSYAWSFTSAPAGSNASLSDETAATPSFVADVEGTYGVQLIVDDGKVASAPDAATLRANPEPEEVAVDNVTWTSGDKNSFSKAHTISGSNRLLTVAVHCDSGDKPISSVTYDGRSLTRVASIVHGDGKPRLEVYRLLAPRTGTRDVQVRLSGGNADKCAVAAISYTGVDQNQPIDGVETAKGDGQDPSVSVSAGSRDMVQGSMASAASGKPSQRSGRGWYNVEMGGSGASDHYAAGGTEFGGWSVSMRWRSSESKAWVAVGLNINAAGGD